ncbi:NEAT domain-containing protein, partial [Pontibacillus litoralis]
MTNKMKKYVISFFAFVVFFSTMLPSTSHASTGIQDGTYDLQINVLKENEEKTSMMDQYVNKPGKLVVENGKQFAVITFNHSDWIKWFKVDRNDEFVDAEVIDVNEQKNERTVKFEVDDISKPLRTQVRVEIPFMNYYNTYITRYVLTPVIPDNGNSTDQN